jgi:hypothetical protein
VHPSVDQTWSGVDEVRSGLSRLKRLGYVRNGPVELGGPSIWRPSEAGNRFLAGCVLFKPEPWERRRPAA